VVAMLRRPRRSRRLDSSIVQLAGPGIPPDLQLALLRELAHASRSDNRRTIFITADTTSDSGPWASTRLDDLTQTRDQRN
jgi:hypothetical protein